MEIDHEISIIKKVTCSNVQIWNEWKSTTHEARTNSVLELFKSKADLCCNLSLTRVKQNSSRICSTILHKYENHRRRESQFEKKEKLFLEGNSLVFDYETCYCQKIKTAVTGSPAKKPLKRLRAKPKSPNKYPKEEAATTSRKVSIGRPGKKFAECGTRSKRTKAVALLENHSVDELLFAAQVGLQKSGQRLRAKLIKKSSSQIKHAKKEKKGPEEISAEKVGFVLFFEGFFNNHLK